MARDENYWARWNFKQKYGYFPNTKRNPNTSAQIPDAVLEEQLKGKDVPQDEWGGDRPISIVNPATGNRQGLSPQIECPECYVRTHTKSRMDNHILANHPDITDLPGKQDGMVL
jgi:hypothetical protein